MRIHILILSSIISLASFNAKAVVIGDKEWFPIKEIVGYSYNDFNTIFDTATGECDVEGCMLGGEVDLTGYTWATLEDVIKMWNAIPGQTNIATVPVNRKSTIIEEGVGMADLFYTFFEPVLNLDENFKSSTGIVRENGTTNPLTVVVQDSYGNEAHGKDFFTLFLPYDAFDERNQHHGAWIYKQVSTSSVPIPPSIALLATGLLGLGFVRLRLHS